MHTWTKPELQAETQLWSFYSASECMFSQLLPDWGEKTKTRTEITLLPIQLFIICNTTLTLNVWMKAVHIFVGSLRQTIMPALQAGSRYILLQFLDELDNRHVKFKSSFARSADEKSICNVSDKNNNFITWKCHFEEL